MFASSLATAKEASKLQEQMEEEKRRKKLENLKKPRKQGWHKPEKSKEMAIPDDSTATMDTTLTRDYPPVEVLSLEDDSDDVSTIAQTPAGRTNTPAPSAKSSSSKTSGGEKARDPMTQALIDAMDNDSMSDVTLMGKPGVQVKAMRYVLACRNPALKEILYASTTAPQAAVFLGNYSETVIMAMKEHCHRGSIKKSSLVTDQDETAVRGLVELTELAQQYDFQSLYGEVDAILCQIINANPSLATAGFDAITTASSPIKKHLLKFIRKGSPNLLIKTDALLHIDNHRLVPFLTEAKCSDCETLLYLIKWMKVRAYTPESMTVAQDAAVRLIDLSALLLSNPAAYAPIVKSSKLYSTEQIDSILLSGGGLLSPKKKKKGRVSRRASASHVPSSPSLHDAEALDREIGGHMAGRSVVNRRASGSHMPSVGTNGAYFASKVSTKRASRRASASHASASTEDSHQTSKSSRRSHRRAARRASASHGGRSIDSGDDSRHTLSDDDVLALLPIPTRKESKSKKKSSKRSSSKSTEVIDAAVCLAES